MGNCPLCGHEGPKIIYEQDHVSAFQNKVYPTRQEALDAVQSSLRIMQCAGCGFVWNAVFDPSVMDYDENYQNEQGCSEFFKDYLNSVLGVVKKHVSPGGRIVEVGCGKGLFLNMLREAGFTVTGFDPAYEGEDPDVECRYFDSSLEFEPAEMVVLRHTLEHVPDPLGFLQAISEANGGKGKIFIEVPCFDWIVGKRAFWDFFHEHCNYFNTGSLSAMFEEAETGAIFGGQYLYLVADLDRLRDKAVALKEPRADAASFQREIGRLQEFVRECSPCLVWGAGAKGAVFTILTDPEGQYISAIIDINPNKQGRFLGKTGHPILGPDRIGQFQGANVIVMNENYRNEVRQITAPFGARLYILGEI